MRQSDTSFREQLVAQLPQWVGQGLLSQAQAEAIAQHHKLHEVHAAEPRSFATYLLVAGGLLVGLGLISFVAANWALIPHSVRCLVALFLMVGFQFLGLRDASNGDRQGRSMAFLLLGHLMLGATMGLLAQWFQIDGDGWGLFALWAGGVAASALALRHAPLGILAGLLWLGAFYEAPSALGWAFTFSSAFVLVPLALYVASPFTLFLGAMGGVVGALVMAGKGGYFLFTAAWLLVVAGWWGNALLGQAILERGRFLAFFQPQLRAKSLSFPSACAVPLLAFLGLLQVQAWKEFWEDRDTSPWLHVGAGEWAVLAALALVALALWLQSSRTAPDGRIHWGLVGLGLVALLLELGRAVLPLSFLIALGNLNLLLGSLALAAVGMWRGERTWFWMGFSSLAIMVTSRFFEYTEGLMLKAAVFTAWGLILMLGGAWAEKRFYQALKAKQALRGERKQA